MSDLENSIQHHIQHLSQTIGPRPSGTPGCQAAAQYIAAQMKRCGLDVEEQPFACPSWSCEAQELEVNGQPVEVWVNPYSPACNVTAPIVSAATLAELETAEISGKIALLYGDLTRAPIACKSWFLKEPRDERILWLLEQKAPAAVLTVQIQPGSINRILEDWEFGIPSATLPAESALCLFNHPDAPVHLRLQTHQEPGETANIVGRRPGQTRNTVVICAHYDTKIDTPGACDNATGVASLLALAEYYASQPTPQTNLEFVAFSNEEYLPIGDETYLARVGEERFNQTRLAINFDGLGFRLDANTIAIYSASEAFQNQVEGISRAYPTVQWVEPWPESNHSTFSWRGIPALAFSSQAMRHYAHQRDDSMRLSSAARVEEAVRLAAQVVDAIQAQPNAWLRPTSTI